MYTLILRLAILTGLVSCNPQADEFVQPQCNIPATIRNLTGLDGCGYMLILDDGQRLEPYGEEWANFVKVDSQRVTVAYHTINAASKCMTGQAVELDCVASISGE